MLKRCGKYPFGEFKGFGEVGNRMAKIDELDVGVQSDELQYFATVANLSQKERPRAFFLQRMTRPGDKIQGQI